MRKEIERYRRENRNTETNRKKWNKKREKRRKGRIKMEKENKKEEISYDIFKRTLPFPRKKMARNK